jgi:hypothetical protein
VIYRISNHNANTVHAQIDGKSGAWVLFLKDDSHFCWHRTGWLSFGCTADQVRCDDALTN